MRRTEVSITRRRKASTQSMRPQQGSVICAIFFAPSADLLSCSRWWRSNMSAERTSRFLGDTTPGAGGGRAAEWNLAANFSSSTGAGRMAPPFLLAAPLLTRAPRVSATHGGRPQTRQATDSFPRDSEVGADPPPPGTSIGVGTSGRLRHSDSGSEEFDLQAQCERTRLLRARHSDLRQNSVATLTLCQGSPKIDCESCPARSPRRDRSCPYASRFCCSWLCAQALPIRVSPP